MKLKLILALLAILGIFIFGCAQVAENTKSDKKDALNSSNSNPELLAGTTAKYYEFSREHYGQSLNEGKIIFLDFYASWCPICRSENPSILAAFNELNKEDVVGYRVHYNDDETTKDDIEMAKKFGITYQHTKVIIDSSGNAALKSLEAFS